MSGTRAIAMDRRYLGPTGFTSVVEIDRYLSEIENDSVGSSFFYSLIRFLSCLVVFIFLGLLISSILFSGPVHWAVAVVGCFGSIGFAGAVWLSESIVKGKDV